MLTRSDQLSRTLRTAVAGLVLSAAAWAGGTFGRVVSIGGQAADIALDESRGVLYIANYGANRVEVMRTADRAIPRSINIPYPASLSVSPDSTYLVVASYANFQTAANATTLVGQPSNILTLVNLNNNVQQTISVGYPPLGVAFGADGLALVLTTKDISLLDPVSGSLTTLTTIAAVNSLVLPVPAASLPPTILTASLGVSGDGMVIYGVTNSIFLTYSVAAHAVVAGGYIASPTLGPRLISVNNDGSQFLAGWGMFSTTLGPFAYQFPDVSGSLSIGSHAIDSAAGLIYAQIPDSGPPPVPPTSQTQCFSNGICVTLTIPPPAGTPPPIQSTPPNLMISDLDNLTVHERILIPENLGGRSILNSARDTLYSASESGVTVFQLGLLKSTPQLVASQEDVLFQGSFCDRRTLQKQIDIVDPNGGHTDFKLTLSDPTIQGISFSQTSGITPATVTISIDPNVYQNQNGTTTAFVRLESATAVNLQPAVPCPKPSGTSTWAAGCFRLLINVPDPDERGNLVNVPGKLVDTLADPVRNRFYVVRQDKNQVLVFDGSSYSQIATLRTLTNPMQMAITPDAKYLLVGHNDAQLISVFDLDTLTTSQPIRMPDGHYPRSVAIAGNTILAASRVAGPTNQISRADLNSRIASAFPTLGAFKNSISADTVLIASPHGAAAMAVEPDGNVLLYDANAGTFTVSRQDFTSLAGTYAASDLGYFVVDNHLLDSSLVKIADFDEGAGGSFGFAFVDQTSVVRTTGPVTPGSQGAGLGVANSPGVIERVNINNAANPATSTRTIEMPVFPSATAPATSGTTTPAVSAFVRTLAPLPSANVFISLTQSGFIALPANFDATTAQPQITGAVNTANQAGGLTGGSLVTVQGSNLSPTTASSNATPAPTTLGNACVTLNGVVIPLFLVSGSQINGQLPNGAGSGTLVVYSPGGISNPFPLNIQPNAPSVLQVPSAAGSNIMIPAVYRVSDNLLVTLSNPVHKGDQLIIYASGLGATNPAIPAGAPAPSSPPAVVLFTPTVTLGGVTLPVTFAGLVPGQIGVYQINVNVPQGITQGLAIPLTVTQGSSSNTVYVRVVQ